MSIPRFVISYVVFTAVLAIAPVALHFSSHSYMLINKFGVLFCFFSVLTFVVSIAVIILNKKKPMLATQAFLAGTTLKLLLCGTIALVYLRGNHVNSVHFLLCFFYLYFMNTAFEVYGLLTNLRN